MMIAGLTGSFGSGKSTVLQYFSRKNWRLFDADKFCHDLYFDPEIAAKTLALFGDGVMQNGVISRREIAGRVFGDPEALRQLNDLIIPAFEKGLKQFVFDCRANADNAVAEIPLLYEGGYEELFDAVLCVWAPPGVRQKRLESCRNFSAEEFSAREQHQMAADKKLERADFAVINSGKAEDLYRQLDELLSFWQR